MAHQAVAALPPSGAGREPVLMTTATLTYAPPQAGITLRGITKTFRGSKGPVRAVRGVDLDITPGETVALLGPNGAGKTTTIDMMLGLLPPDDGEVMLFGMEPTAAVEAGAVGAMLQTGGLIMDLSVREIVTVMASLYPDPLPVDDVLDMTGMAPLAGRRTQKLSGGESQRLRFALALVANPDLMVLDEPTVAMDVEARRAFWATMRRFAARGTTVVFATHYLEEADEFADRIVLMAHGRIVADGPSTEIKAHVGMRTIRATLPGVSPAALAALAGVAEAERHGDAVTLAAPDSDMAIRAFLRAHPQARDIEITGAGLEEAFLQITGEDDPDEEEVQAA
jgi:ABC-2 type transport system ATP-binding protein